MLGAVLKYVVNGLELNFNFGFEV